MSARQTIDTDDREILLRAAGHLRDLAEDIECVEGVLSDLVCKHLEDADDGVVVCLQKIDQVCQSLRDLAVLNTALTESGTAREIAMDQFALSFTRNLLDGRHKEVHEHSGAVELF